MLHNKVSILEIVSEEHSQKNINAILERKKLADARVRQRLMVRRKSKQIKQQKQTKQKLTPEQLVSIEEIRLLLYEKIKTVQRLKAVFNHLDIDHSGMLSKNEFNTLVLKVFKKKNAVLKNGNMLDLIWEAIWEQRKHGSNDEIDASTLSHWLQL